MSLFENGLRQVISEEKSKDAQDVLLNMRRFVINLKEMVPEAYFGSMFVFLVTEAIHQKFEPLKVAALANGAQGFLEGVLSPENQSVIIDKLGSDYFTDRSFEDFMGKVHKIKPLDFVQLNYDIFSIPGKK